MLSAKVQEALNAQVNHEFFAWYQYLAMASHFEAENLLGFAHWMHAQAHEETTHAMKIYKYIVDRRGKVILDALNAPATAWNTPLQVFEASLAHEQKVTAQINKLMDLAISESDHATISFLKWFVDEQVEEESNVDNVIQDLKRVSDSSQGLFLLDRELGQRAGEDDMDEEGDAT